MAINTIDASHQSNPHVHHARRGAMAHSSATTWQTDAHGLGWVRRVTRRPAHRVRPAGNSSTGLTCLLPEVVAARHRLPPGTLAPLTSRCLTSPLTMFTLSRRPLPLSAFGHHDAAALISSTTPCTRGYATPPTLKAAMQNAPSHLALRPKNTIARSWVNNVHALTAWWLTEGAHVMHWR